VHDAVVSGYTGEVKNVAQARLVVLAISAMLIGVPTFGAEGV
jgi:hypothetical protein